MYYIQIYRRKSNTHTLVTKKFNIVIEILLIIYKYYNNSSNTSRLRESALFVDYEDQRICFSLHTMNLELFCFCMPSFCPHRIISLSLLVNRSFLIEEKCRFLSNFSQHTAEVELPGEFLLPKVRYFNVKKDNTEAISMVDIRFYLYLCKCSGVQTHFKKKKKKTFLCLRKRINV